MVSIKQIMICFFVMGFSFVAIVAQNEKKSSKDILHEGIKTFNINDYRDWKKFELQGYSFYTPQGVKKIGGKQCDDSTCYEFKGENFLILTDDSIDSYHPRSIQKSYQSYKDKTFWIGKAYAWFWSFQEENSNYKYRAGVLFQLPENKRLQISVHSEDTDIKSLAEKIILSFQFKEKSKDKKP